MSCCGVLRLYAFVMQTDETVHGAGAESGADAVRLAAVDIGSNSIRLIIAEALSSESYRLLLDERDGVGLAHGAEPDHSLAEETMRGGAQTIARMVETAQGHGAGAIRLVATAAVRDAPNRDTFLELVEESSGYRIEILDGPDEARMAHASVAHAFDLTAAHAAVADIGGGSTDVSISAGGLIERLISLPLGAVRLADRFADGKGSGGSRFAEMRRFVDRALGEGVPRLDVRPQVMFGTGGTFTAVASMDMHRKSVSGGDSWPGASGSGVSGSGPRPIRGYEMTLADVTHLLDYLRSLDDEGRAAVPGLNQNRARIIVPGMCVIESLMRRLEVNNLRVHDRGVRDGIILSMLREHFSPIGALGEAGDVVKPDERVSVLAFGRRCNFDEVQSRHVAKLTLMLFDGMGSALEAQTGKRPDWASDRNRLLLESASMLRDVGYFINYAKHHKHSYHLIAHADLPGFTARETLVIANVARYHRKKGPKKKHEHFAELDIEDQRLVRVLASLLRIGDGLDRTHSQSVTSVEVELGSDAAYFTVHAPVEPATDVYGAQLKSRVFEKTFGLETRYSWRLKPSLREDQG